MRPERTPRTLRQIADACSFVLSVTEGKTLEDYAGERLLRQGVDRNLQIIGEAVRCLRRDDPETADRLSEHERIVGFPNVLVHGYELVDDGIVCVNRSGYKTASRELQDLRRRKRCPASRTG
jgi:uncharacterized protein with HEPN domain